MELTSNTKPEIKYQRCVCTLHARAKGSHYNMDFLSQKIYFKEKNFNELGAFSCSCFDFVQIPILPSNITESHFDVVKKCLKFEGRG